MKHFLHEHCETAHKFDQTHSNNVDEIISRSRIDSDFIWPSADPRNLPQPTRMIHGNDDELYHELLKTKFDSEKFIKTHADKGIVENIINILNHNSFQFNSRGRFRGNSIWWRRLEKAVAAGQPVQILILAFCIIANPTKRIQRTAITLSEDISLLHMSNIAKQISNIYPPGAVFEVISDSTFYALPFNLTSVETHFYLTELYKRVDTLGIQDSVRIHDISDYLAEDICRFQSSYERWKQIFDDDPLADGISEENLTQWYLNMRCSINTKRCGFSYREIVEQLGSEKYSVDKLAWQARTGLTDYRALKAAAAEVEWEDRVFPLAIRATIHSKKNGTLGLRIYPQYKRRSHLLPYHGIGIVERDAKYGVRRMTVQHEMTVVGQASFRRVIDERQRTLFYEKME